MRNKFDAQLSLLNGELTEMGILIESAIANAVKALTDTDNDFAKNTFEYEKEINRKEKDIETLCFKLLLQQQPVARDLRIISAALKMITDMERIGDQAYDIAEITLHSKGKSIEHIEEMAKKAIEMVNMSVEAFVSKDVDIAEKVIKFDDEVDSLFETVKNDLIEIIRNNAEKSENAMDLIMIAKYLERIGDHAVNIAEWVIFGITGKHKEKVDKYCII